ncbi:hypothetical protein C8F01DRAFT_1160347 [Mycena amicta]|nr:hypothetical protein C8F01DRAFT_1160347 [Mycena amicta]
MLAGSTAQTTRMCTSCSRDELIHKCSSRECSLVIPPRATARWRECRILWQKMNSESVAEPGTANSGPSGNASKPFRKMDHIPPDSSAAGDASWRPIGSGNHSHSLLTQRSALDPSSASPLLKSVCSSASIVVFSSHLCLCRVSVVRPFARHSFCLRIRVRLEHICRMQPRSSSALSRARLPQHCLPRNHRLVEWSRPVASVPSSCPSHQTLCAMQYAEMWRGMFREYVSDAST